MMRQEDFKKMLEWACKRIEQEDYSYETLEHYMQLIAALHRILEDMKFQGRILANNNNCHLRLVKTSNENHPF
jgi:hypothetical protein